MERDGENKGNRILYDFFQIGQKLIEQGVNVRLDFFEFVRSGKFGEARTERGFGNDGKGFGGEIGRFQKGGIGGKKFEIKIFGSVLLAGQPVEIFLRILHLDIFKIGAQRGKAHEYRFLENGSASAKRIEKGGAGQGLSEID